MSQAACTSASHQQLHAFCRQKGLHHHAGHELSKPSGNPGRPTTKGGLGPPGQVRRGDSAEELYSAAAGKLPRASLDTLNPLAGTVGIELVPQTLLLTADSLASSASSPTEQSTDAPTASPLAQKQSADTPTASLLAQGQQFGEQPHDKCFTDLPGVAESALHGQLGEATDSDGTVISGRTSTAGQVSEVVGPEHAKQQQQQQQHSKGDLHSMDEQEDTGRDESDDEHAVLIAASEDQSSDVPEQTKVLEPTVSKKRSAAAERQRVWYKERAVQLTIFG